jgi:hypothetical protein
MDCNQNFKREYQANPLNTPRVLIEWTLLNDGETHFSYEDMGSLKLSTWLVVIQLVFMAAIGRSYYQAIQNHERYLTPHAIMIISLYMQVVS